MSPPPGAREHLEHDGCRDEPDAEDDEHDQRTPDRLPSSPRDQRSTGDARYEQAGDHEEPREHRERRQRVDTGEVVEVALHIVEHLAHVGVDRRVLRLELGEVGELLLVRRPIDAQCGRGRRVDLVIRLDHRGVDLAQEATELDDLGLGHERTELVDHLAARGSPFEHLEQRRRGDQPEPEHDERDQEAISPRGQARGRSAQALRHGRRFVGHRVIDRCCLGK